MKTYNVNPTVPEPARSAKTRTVKWKARVVKRLTIEEVSRRVVEDAAPSAANLAALSQKHPPRKSWYQETVDPFVSD